jgi:hypothetical protein
MNFTDSGASRPGTLGKVSHRLPRRVGDHGDS